MVVMNIGYACINTEINCTSNSTFRLKSYSEEKLRETIKNNLICLKKILEFNVEHNILFFRIGSNLIPFASHEIFDFDWKKYFKNELEDVGKYIKINNLRVSMHPGQYIVLNSNNKNVVEKSIIDIQYHCDVLDAMKLGEDCKIELHVGGIYGDKSSAIKQFINNYKRLNSNIKKRLVIENDDKSYSLKDCLDISKVLNIPVVFDVFHHECLNNKESFIEGIRLTNKTWKPKDGKQFIHYSDQKANAKRGSHSETIDLKKFKIFLKEIKQFDLDIMLEVKDKEQSVLKIHTELNKK